MRTALLQLNPRLGQVGRNIERATNLLANGIGAGGVDLVVLPELAFTGYKFGSRDKIEPYLEVQESGTTSSWAKNTSTKYRCFTLVGYPEISLKDSRIYNSVVMTSPQGQVVCNYRKTHLFSADEQWGCSESPRGFFSAGAFQIGTHTHRVQIGVCMDLNPRKFEAPFEAFEFASSVVANRVSLVVCPMAWLHSQSPGQEPALDKHTPDSSTIDYWALRMSPFWTSGTAPVKVFLACNRSGCEDNVLYAGSSSVIVCRSGQRPVLVRSSSHTAEELVVCDIDG